MGRGRKGRARRQRKRAAQHRHSALALALQHDVQAKDTATLLPAGHVAVSCVFTGTYHDLLDFSADLAHALRPEELDPAAALSRTWLALASLAALLDSTAILGTPNPDPDSTGADSTGPDSTGHPDASASSSRPDAARLQLLLDLESGESLLRYTDALQHHLITAALCTMLANGEITAHTEHGAPLTARDLPGTHNPVLRKTTRVGGRRRSDYRRDSEQRAALNNWAAQLHQRLQTLPRLEPVS